MKVVGVLSLLIDVPWSGSLKDKRSVVSSLKGRIEARFRVSVAEVGDLGDWHSGELAVACVANDVRHVDEMLARIANFSLANPGDGVVAEYRTEILHVD